MERTKVLSKNFNFRHKIRHPTTGYEGPEGEQRYIDIDIYLTAIGLAPGGGITRHIYNQTIPNLQREKNFDSAVRTPSLLSVIPLHSPNN